MCRVAPQARLVGNDLLPPSRAEFPIGFANTYAGLFVALLIERRFAVLSIGLLPSWAGLLIAAEESITALDLDPVLVVAATMGKARFDAGAKLDIAAVFKLDDPRRRTGGRQRGLRSFGRRRGRRRRSHTGTNPQEE